MIPVIGSLFLLAGGMICLQVIVPYFDTSKQERLVFDLWLNEKRALFEGLGSDASVDILGEPVPCPGTTRSGGQLEWSLTLPSCEGEPVSTPALVDLDGDRDLEIVVASSGDAVFAFNSDGTPFWAEPYTDDVIDYLGQTAGTSGLDFEPPPFFSSPVTADLNEKEGLEVFLGVKNGLLCLGSDGSRLWRKGLTTGHYFSSPCVTDLEGEWSGRKEDLEVVCAADDESRRGWIEAYGGDGANIFRDEAPTGGEGGLIGCAVVAQDLDGDFWDGPEQVTPGQDREKDTELILGNHDRGLRIWGRSGQTPDGRPTYDETTTQMSGGHQTYATAAVANVTGGQDCEIFIGSSEGYACTWTGWGGMLHVYDPYGKQLWSYNVGSSDASIFSSPALADLQGAAADPVERHIDYEVIFGNDRGVLYVMNTEFHNLNWCFDTKGRVLSSPAVCNIDRNDELEIIIGSDSGYVYCLDGDPSDGENDGVEYPGDSTGSDVIWAYDTKNPIGISSPVVADIDLDGMLEVVIGDMEGHLYCISAGGCVTNGQADWPVFHCNGNRTGFYNPQTSLGIDIHPKMTSNGTKEPIRRSVAPGEEVLFNLTVSNKDSDLFLVNKHVVDVGVQNGSVPHGWSAWLDTPPDKGMDDPPYVRLGSGEDADIVLHLRAPRDGRMVKLARVNVTCVSTYDTWSRDMISVNALLDVSMDPLLAFDKLPSTDRLDPLCGKKWERIGPGTVHDLSATVRNTGDLNASVSVALNGPPLEAGWNWYFTDTGGLRTDFELTSTDFEGLYGGISEVPLRVRVEVPENAPEGQLTPVLLTCTSRPLNATGIDDGAAMDELKVLVEEQNDLRLGTNDDVLHAMPNTTAVHFVRISNNGNNDMIDVQLDVEQVLKGWKVTLPDTPVRVYMGQKKTVPVKVTPPGYAHASVKQVLVMTATIEGSPDIFDRLKLTTIVDNVYSFDAVVLNKNGIKMDPGRTGMFAVQVSNTGNDHDSLKARAWKMEPGWELSLFNAEGNQKDEFPLDIDTSMTIEGLLKIPFNTRTGWYMVELNFTGIGSTITVSLKVFVNQSFGLEVTMVDGFEGQTMEVRPRQERSLVLKVKNNGNGLDRIVLSIDADTDGTDGSVRELPEGWEGTFYAVSNTPGLPPNIRFVDLREPIYVPGDGPDIYLTSSMRNLSGAPNVDHHELFLLLDGGCSAYVHLRVRAPSEGTEHGIFDIIVSGQGMGGSKDHDSATLRFELLFPNIQFYGGIAMSGGTASRGRIAKDGEHLTIQVNVRNTGSINVEDVDVALYIDGQHRMTRTIKTLESDTGSAADLRTVAFSWVAEEGRHRVKVVIDPEDTIIESDGGEGQDNTLIMAITVKGRSSILGGMNDSPVMSMVLFVLLIVLSFTVFVMVIRLRKRG